MLPIRTDCRSYTGSAPCRFHKQDGRACACCRDYDPVTSRLLVVKLAAVGDVLRTTSLLPALRRAFPGAQITWVTERASAAVLEGHPLIDRVLTTDACLPALLTETFDVVYGLDADTRSAGLATLARAGRRLGFTCDTAGRVVPATDAAVEWWMMGLDDRRKRQNRRTYQAIMYDLCELPGPIERPSFVVPDDSRRRAAAFMNDAGLVPYASVLGLNTGGGKRWAQKKWTPEGYEAFIALARARHPDMAIVLLGGPEEEELNASLMTRAGDGVFDAGCSNPFADFAALIAAMDALVTSDSLGLHAATAVGTPAVVFAGPTSPWELELYGQGTVVHAGVDCLGCYLAACDKPVTCMEALHPRSVLEAVERVVTCNVRVPRADVLRADSPRADMLAMLRVDAVDVPRGRGGPDGEAPRRAEAPGQLRT